MFGSEVVYHKAEKKYSAKLSLVALMDIFTILVFFLLLNSGDGSRIENAKFVEIPDSKNGSVAHEQLIVYLDESNIYLGDRKLDNYAVTDGEKKEPFIGLANALDEIVAARKGKTPFEVANGYAITLMGDKSLPYETIKMVMNTCRLKNFRNISLAVNYVVTPALSAAPVSSSPLIASVNGG